MLPTVGYAGWLLPKWVPFLPEANKTVRISSSIYIKRKGNDFEWQIKWLFIAPASLVGCFICIQIISNCVPFVEKVTPNPLPKKANKQANFILISANRKQHLGFQLNSPLPSPIKKRHNSFLRPCRLRILAGLCKEVICRLLFISATSPMVH